MWEEYSVIAGGEHLEVVDPSFVPLSYYLGALGKHQQLVNYFLDLSPLPLN